MGLARIYLAACVVSWHAGGPTLDFIWINGGIAVLCFYMFSGFLIALVLDKKYQGNVRGFYAARIGRIFPIYFAVALAVVGAMIVLRAPNPFAGHHMNAWQWAFVIFTNVGILGLDLYPFIDPSFATSEMRIVPIAWTLSVEIQFYLVAPLLMKLRLRYLAAALAALLIIRFSLLSAANAELWRYFFAPSVWCFFVMGAVSYRLSRDLLDSPHRALFTVSAFALIAVAIHVGDPHARKDYDAPELWFFYVAFVLATPFLFALTKKDHLDGLIGNLSYPIYLTHLSVSQVVGFAVTGGFLAWPLTYAPYFSHLRAMVYGSVLCSMILLVVEAPTREWVKRHFARRAMQLPASPQGSLPLLSTGQVAKATAR